MVKKYNSKRDKAAAPKGQAAWEGWSLRGTKRVMDVELFLDGQAKWEEDSPHWLAMMYEIFRHAANKGQKEAEHTVHWGCQEGLPKVNPEVDLSAIQLVSPKTTKEEILSLYLEVYKQQRLPGPPPGEPELMQEVVSSFEGHQGLRESRASSATMRPQSEDAWPLKSGVPGRKETSVEQSLANVREAHQKALAVAAALEGEIERLSHPLSQRQLEVRARSKSKDCQTYGSTECKKRWHQVRFSDTPTSLPLAKENMGSGGEELTPEDSDHGEPPELEPGVTSFLTGLAENSEEEGSPPEPLVGELHKWVMWKAKATKTPDWWRELLALLGVPNCKKLAWQIQASFSHPRRATEMEEMKYHCHAPPAPLCLLWDHFLLPPSTIFACRDIWEVQREKTIAYAHALQYWAEKSNLSTGGQLHWLAESVK